ncbi:MAG: hypothetical protein WBW03_21225 [Silvibacterium sp.]|jgi:hypothetical protein
MPQKELDLLQFSVYVAQLCTGPPKMVRSEVIKLNPLGAASNDITRRHSQRFLDPMKFHVG